MWSYGLLIILTGTKIDLSKLYQFFLAGIVSFIEYIYYTVLLYLLMIMDVLDIYF